MERLRYLALAGIGILVALSVLPQTSWIVRNDLAYLGGESPARDYYGCLAPVQSPTTSDQELANAMAASRQEPVARMRALNSYCRSHPDDPRGWAVLLRQASRVPLYAPGAQKPPLDANGRNLHALATSSMLLAAGNGERLEPENLWFPVVHATVLGSLGRLDEARRLILSSAAKTDYNDHSEDEVLVRYAAAQSKCGFRGQTMKLEISAGIMFAELAHVSHLLPSISKGHRDVRLALLRICHTAAQKADSAIAVLVYASVFRRALVDTTDRTAIEPARLAASAAQLGTALHTAEPGLYLSDFSKVVTHPQDPEEARSEHLYEEAVRPPLGSSLILAAVLLCIPAMAALLLLSRMKHVLARGVESTAEHSLTLARVLLLLDVGLLILFGCLFAFAPGEAVPFLAAAEALLVCLGFWLARGFGDAREGRAYRSRWFWSGLLLVAGTVGLVAVSKGADSQVLTAALVSTTVFLIGLAIVLLPRRAGDLLAVPALLFTLLPICYLVAVVRTVRLDAEIGKMVDDLNSEAARYRGQWHVNP